MDLIIGGAYQGKLTLAAREYGLTPGDICDLAAGAPVPGARCYVHLEALTRRQEATGGGPLPLLTGGGGGGGPGDRQRRGALWTPESGRGGSATGGCCGGWRSSAGQRAPGILRIDGGIEMKLTLLRHGETDGSRRDLYYGAADIPALPESLAALHENAAAYPRAARYYTSGLLRTEQTLEAIYGPVAHQQLPGLREMNFGDFEMKSYQELKDTAAYRAWITDVEHNVCPNGESAPQVLERNRAAMAQVLAAGEDAVCVIHGGVTAGLMMTWFGGGRYDYSVKPGTGFTVTFRDGEPVSYERVPE